MRYLSIDRFDGNYAICEDDNKKMFAISLAEMPENAKEGSVIAIDSDGIITVDQKLTDDRRGKIKKLQDSVWE